VTDIQLHFAWRAASYSGRFQTGVSLHSHTMHSKESLDFLPRIARTVPVVSQVVAFQEACYTRKHGHPPGYENAYWTPPLSEREALALELAQIESVLGLQPLVSLSDHDNIEAAIHLHVLPECRTAPVSVEWTVPYGPTFFTWAFTTCRAMTRADGWRRSPNIRERRWPAAYAICWRPSTNFPIHLWSSITRSGTRRASASKFTDNY
jgi:hypothetical protein